MIDGHKAQYLAAFDLSQASVTFKVYFIPTQRSHRDGIPAWDVVHAAFMEISEHNKPMRLALEKLSTFYRSCSEKCGLKVEFVGSDCLPASQARAKIYFRTSSTSFQSVRYIMALGGLLNSDNAEAALKKLRVLWNLVLGLDTDCTPRERTKSCLRFHIGQQEFCITFRCSVGKKCQHRRYIFRYATTPRATGRWRNVWRKVSGATRR